jgi:hypothetical protein
MLEVRLNAYNLIEGAILSETVERILDFDATQITSTSH